MKADLVLLHPPSIFDFRERPILWGPINDLVPSTPVFEMYPLGFVSIASTLEQHGYRVRIVNIALKMLRDPGFNPAEYLSRMQAEAFGIDLHWLPHVHGAINLARVCKEVHPEVPVIFGGLSSSYFHRELLSEVPQVDYVLRGDSTEVPFVKLMEVIEGRGDAEEVPNLSYREGDRLRVNPLSHVPESIDCFNLDYEYIFRSFVRSKNLDMLPFLDFIEHPIMAVLTRKGCECNCTACGGSSYAYARICNRHGVAFRSPEKVVEDILAVQEFQVPAFILGDLAIGGERYGRRILEMLRRERVDIPLIFEAFLPFSRGFMREISRSVDDFTIEMSPDSGVEEVRRKIGRNYSNAALRDMLEKAFSCGCRQFDLYFSVGLGGQSEESIHATLKLAEQLMEEHRGRRLLPFISPYAPFLDPGSIAYEHPERCGFVKFAESMMDHYRILDTGLSWKDFLSYRTTHLSREDIVRLSYQAALRLAELKAEAGIIDLDSLEEIRHRIEVSQDMIRVVEAHRRGECSEVKMRESLMELRERVMIDRRELDWSKGLKFRRIVALLRKLITA